MRRVPPSPGQARPRRRAGEAALHRRERLEAARASGEPTKRVRCRREPFAVRVQERARGEDRRPRPAPRPGPRARVRASLRRSARSPQCAAAERLRRGDHDRAVRVGRLEDRRRTSVDRVREDVRAGHQRDAERDRDRRQQRRAACAAAKPRRTSASISPRTSSGRAPRSPSPPRRRARSARRRAPAADRRTTPRARRA